MRKSALIVLAAIIAVFIYAWEQMYAKKLSYDISRLESGYKKLVDENASLYSKKDSIISLERMDRISNERKLKRADEKSIVRLDINAKK
jgi:hypothetical protein